MSLLVAVMSWPQLPQLSADKAFQTTCLVRNFSTPPDVSTRLHLEATTDNSWVVKADVMDDDEEDKSGHSAGYEFLFAIVPRPPCSERSIKPIIHSHLGQASPVLRC